MKKVGFLFPGQGAQSVGMGKSVYEACAESKAIFDSASEILGYDLADICFNGPEEKLTQTRFSQPAIFTTSVAVLAALKQQVPSIEPAASLGLSLGEYTALVAAGVVSFEDGLVLVQKRAEAMDDAASKAGGSMASIIGGDREMIDTVVDGIDGVWVANLNSPEQIVISGTVEGVESAMAQIKEKGAKRVIPLKVSGAFHSGLMKPAEEMLSSAVADTAMQEPTTVFVPNFTAQPEADVAKIKSGLLSQLTGTVKWFESVLYVAGTGVTEFIEIGPGTVLKGLARKTSRDLSVASLQTMEDVQAFKESLQ